MTTKPRNHLGQWIDEYHKAFREHDLSLLECPAERDRKPQMIKIRLLYWIYRWSRRLADYAENWADRLYLEHCNNKGSLTTLEPISQATSDSETSKVED